MFHGYLTIGVKICFLSVIIYNNSYNSLHPFVSPPDPYVCPGEGIRMSLRKGTLEKLRRPAPESGPPRGETAKPEKPMYPLISCGSLRELP
jgi:hypothetical protein